MFASKHYIYSPQTNKNYVHPGIIPSPICVPYFIVFYYIGPISWWNAIWEQFIEQEGRACSSIWRQPISSPRCTYTEARALYWLTRLHMGCAVIFSYYYYINSPSRLKHDFITKVTHKTIQKVGGTSPAVDVFQIILIPLVVQL